MNDRKMEWRWVATRWSGRNPGKLKKQVANGKENVKRRRRRSEVLLKKKGKMRNVIYKGEKSIRIFGLLIQILHSWTNFWLDYFTLLFGGPWLLIRQENTIYSIHTLSIFINFQFYLFILNVICCVLTACLLRACCFALLFVIATYKGLFRERENKMKNNNTITKKMINQTSAFFFICVLVWQREYLVTNIDKDKQSWRMVPKKKKKNVES